jgi:S1-C subfamily serine protease
MRDAWSGLALATTLALSACATSSGEPAAGFMDSAVQAAFIPLSGVSDLNVSGHGAAVVLAPGIAVTNAHNANLIDATAIVGQSQQYDLLYFRTDQGSPMQSGSPHEGEQVVAYGEGLDGTLRVSYGVVRKVGVPVKARCPSCSLQKAFTFEGDAGPGFSGGPVIDAADGTLVGITFGYLDDSAGSRVMYAYDMARVNAEFANLRAQPGGKFSSK